MKKLFILFLIVFSIGVKAQVKKGIDLSVSSGITIPMGDYKEYMKNGESIDIGFPLEFYGYSKERKGKLQFNIDASYQFGSLGAGISYGQFTHEISNFNYKIDFPRLIEGGEIKGSYYGLGPNYIFPFGKLQFITSARAGMMNFKVNDFKVSYNGSDALTPIEILSTNMNSEAKSSLFYSSFGVKLSYPVYKSVNLFIKADYFTTFGDGIKLDDHFYLPFDVDIDQEILIGDVNHFTLIDYEKNESRFIKPQMLNIGAGLTYVFGNGKVKKTPPPEHERHSPFFTKRTQIKTKEPTQIVLTYPQNGAQFKDGKSFKNFKWQILGKNFKNPKYVIEVIPSNRKKGTLIAFSPTENIDFKNVFKELKPNGLYSWRVIEQNTGNSSDIKTFAFTNCDNNMSIDNVEAECLGYEGSDRKFKICFDVVYSSATGDLTYNDTGSGLSVYDQSYTNLTYNLVGSNTSLQTQIGTTQTTVHYCFETLVDNSVTAIGFALQGDDLDPNPNVNCQPGVSNGVDELPSCLCDDCDDMIIEFNQNSITQTSNPSIFTFDGTISTGQPIYGVAFQIVSLNYASSPNACSNGITNLEESGMFLQAGTTINNSNSVQFINETASQSPNSNTNASKNIKYSSNGALNGNTPFSLNIGLPQPVQGLNSGCCQIDYEICIKVDVFYEDGTCKTCTLTKCFNFNNQ